MSESQASKSTHLTRIQRWPLWQLRRPALAFILATDLLALLVTVAALRSEPATAGNYVRVAAILFGAIAYGEACDRIERLRRYLGDNAVRANHLSTWTVAAMLVAPPGLACTVCLLLYAHAMVMGRRHQSVRPHRMIFTGCAATLATWATLQAVDGVFGADFPGPGVAGAAATLSTLVLLFCIDTAIMGAGVCLATGTRDPRAALPSRDVTLFEFGTQIIGVLAAQLLLHSAWLAPVAVGCLVAMHRASLVKQLQVAAETDTKTGLLNAAAWRQRANEMLQRAIREQQRVAMIVIDLDHFKRVNDKYGHLVGDQVLRNVGALLKRESRSHDLVGRFGGEEFVILIDGRTAAAHAVDMATRLRARIAALEFPFGLQVTASLGVAHQVPSNPDLDAIVAAADAALYAAKDAGRDRVHAVSAV